MTMKSVSVKSSTPSPKKYLKPGALTKLRNSRITATYQRYASRNHVRSLSQLLLTPNSPSSSSTDSEQHSPNQDNGVPCFAQRVNSHRPQCLTRKKLFAVTPFFTEADTHHF
ncbi:hypothetical protein RIF29_04701 [Crotalaria pallida]|uniref:Uncharacterized protein n=1 Tax=Crotalaria pallida TaxID=3830 RepID=A0AAN9J1A2_CROPI